MSKKSFGLFRQIFHQIENQLPVEKALVGAGIQNMPAVDQHDLTGFVGNHRYRHGRHFRAGELFAEYLSRSQLRQNTPVAVIVHTDHLYGAGEHDPQILGRGSLGKDGVFFV